LKVSMTPLALRVYFSFLTLPQNPKSTSSTKSKNTAPVVV